MRQDDRQLGKPLRAYRGTTAAIEGLALGADDEGCIAYSTDDDLIGTFDGAAWTWIDTGIVPNHLHAGVAGDGGQLDWDDIWSDAVHDHSEAGEGGQTLGDTAGPLTVTVANSGLHILDTGNDHDLIITPGSDLNADRILTLTTGDAARTITLSGDPTLDDWFDQSVKQAATPTFAGVTLPAVTFDGLTGANVVTIPDNLADALHIVDDGDADEYLRIVTTTGSEEIIFNAGADDVDFTVEASGVADAFQVQGSDGQITLGALGAGAVQSTAGGIISSGPLPLADLADYTQGDLIYGGAAGWEDLAHQAAADHVLQSTANEVGWSAETLALAAAGAGYALVSTAANAWAADDTPAWVGVHTFEAGAAIAAGQGLAMGDASWLGIAGNELLTVNAAGNFTFSGITSLVVPNGAWVGADAACSWVFDSANGDVTTLDNVGIGTAGPLAKLDVSGAIIADNTVIDPDTTADKVMLGQIADGSGWSAIGMGMMAGGAGDTAGIGVAANFLYFAVGDGVNANSFDTWLRVTMANLDTCFYGNVGIGTTGPAQNLHIYHTANVGLGLAFDCQGTQNAQSAQMNFLTLGDGTKAPGVAGTKGWHFVARGNAYATVAQQNDLLIYSFDGAAFQLAQYWDSAGNVGFGTPAPQGLVHGHDTIGGFMYWEYDGVGAAAQTIIPNAAGDVVYRLSISYVVRASDTTTFSGSIGINNGANANIDPGAGTLTLAVAATGAATIQRTGGALTYKVALWLLWI